MFLGDVFHLPEEVLGKQSQPTYDRIEYFKNLFHRPHFWPRGHFTIPLAKNKCQFSQQSPAQKHTQTH